MRQKSSPSLRIIRPQRLGPGSTPGPSRHAMRHVARLARRALGASGRRLWPTLARRLVTQGSSPSSTKPSACRREFTWSPRATLAGPDTDPDEDIDPFVAKSRYPSNNCVGVKSELSCDPHGAAGVLEEVELPFEGAPQAFLHRSSGALQDRRRCRHGERHGVGGLRFSRDLGTHHKGQQASWDPRR